MSSTIKQIVGTSRASLTTSALNSLGSGTYVSAGTITFESSSKRPLAAKLEVKVTPGTVADPKQVAVFAKVSLDGTNFGSGPESGTTTTDEPNLTPIGVIPCNTNSQAQTAIFDLVAAFGGALPHSAKIIVKNESGAALASSGHHVYYEFVDGDIT